MFDPDLAQKLKNFPPFMVFQEHILDEIAKLSSVKGLDEMSDIDAGQTARVRALSAKKLREILSPVLDYSEKWKPTEEDVRKREDELGL